MARLAILEAYDVETSLFEKILEHLWFGAPVKRYLARIKRRGKTRFTVKGAAKDYHLITTTLYSHGYPAIVSTSLKNFYTAALYKYGEEDYPRAIYWLLKKIEKEDKNKIT